MTINWRHYMDRLHKKKKQKKMINSYVNFTKKELAYNF